MCQVERYISVKLSLQSCIETSLFEFELVGKAERRMSARRSVQDCGGSKQHLQ